MLDRAGNPEPWTVERVMGAKGAALILGFVLGFLLRRALASGAASSPLGLAAALFHLPGSPPPQHLSAPPGGTLRKGLADALDMLTVCVEAGQGFDAALIQVSRNVEGPIAGEFARVLSEIQLGNTRGDAFSALGDRVALPEVKNFITALVQADRLGLPIGAVLREQTGPCGSSRRRRRRRRPRR